MPESTDRGALTEAVFYILLAVKQPTHGYGIMKHIRELTHDRVILGSGTLYGALGKLLKNNWIQIESRPEDDKKYYVLTPVGNIILENEITRLKELVAHGGSVLASD